MGGGGFEERVMLLVAVKAVDRSLFSIVLVVLLT